MRGWRISPAHFVERFGLLIIVALGESIVAIGVGASGVALDRGVIAAAVLGFAVAAVLWWAYFDWVIYVAKAALVEATGPRRAALARDAYSYLHLPMVVGIVLFAFGVETTIHDVSDPLRPLPALGLCGGIALYLLAHVGLRLRLGAGLGRGRPVASVLLLALVPVARDVSALAALGIVASICVAVIVYEFVRHRDERAFNPRASRQLHHGRGRPRRASPPAARPSSSGSVLTRAVPRGVNPVSPVWPTGASSASCRRSGCGGPEAALGTGRAHPGRLGSPVPWCDERRPR